MPVILPQLPHIDGLTSEKVATLVNALKSYKQFEQYVDNLRKNICPFCDPLGPINVVIKTVGQGSSFAWRAWHNPYPIQGPNPNPEEEKKRIVSAETHLVIAPVRHVTSPSQMATEDWVNQALLIRFATTSDSGDGLNLPGGGILTRFGRPELNAGSILHIHTNVIVPNLLTEVRPPLAKDPKEMEHDYRILAVFAKMTGGIPFNGLSNDEQELVKDRLG